MYILHSIKIADIQNVKSLCKCSKCESLLYEVVHYVMCQQRNHVNLYMLYYHSIDWKKDIWLFSTGLSRHFSYRRIEIQMLIKERKWNGKIATRTIEIFAVTFAIWHLLRKNLLICLQLMCQQHINCTL